MDEHNTLLSCLNHSIMRILGHFSELKKHQEESNTEGGSQNGNAQDGNGCFFNGIHILDDLQASYKTILDPAASPTLPTMETQASPFLYASDVKKHKTTPSVVAMCHNRNTAKMYMW
eukprot:6023090-Amphidinium_carterae.1